METAAGKVRYLMPLMLADRQIACSVTAGARTRDLLGLVSPRLVQARLVAATGGVGIGPG